MKKLCSRYKWPYMTLPEKLECNKCKRKGLFLITMESDKDDEKMWGVKCKKCYFSCWYDIECRFYR